MMLILKGDDRKVLYTELYYAERRLRTLHSIYNETRDMKVLRNMQEAKREMQTIVKRIEEIESADR